MLWDGHYLLEEPLGGGGCEVHRGKDVATHTSVIIKILREGMLASDTAFGEWLRDARVRAEHASVYLPRVLFVKHAPRPYSVSEDVPGPTLAALQCGDAEWARAIAALRSMVASLSDAGIAPRSVYPRPRPLV